MHRMSDTAKASDPERPTAHRLSAAASLINNVATAEETMERIVTTATPTSALASISTVRRPLSAYNIFFQIERLRMINDECDSPYTKKEAMEFVAKQRIIRNFPQPRRLHRKSHGKIGFREMAQVLANKWKALDPSIKRMFEECASLEKERYHQEMNVVNPIKSKTSSPLLASPLIDDDNNNSRQRERKSNRETKDNEKGIQVPMFIHTTKKSSDDDNDNDDTLNDPTASPTPRHQTTTEEQVKSMKEELVRNSKTMLRQREKIKQMELQMKRCIDIQNRQHQLQQLLHQSELSSTIGTNMYPPLVPFLFPQINPYPMMMMTSESTLAYHLLMQQQEEEEQEEEQEQDQEEDNQKQQQKRRRQHQRPQKHQQQYLCRPFLSASIVPSAVHCQQQPKVNTGHSSNKTSLGTKQSMDDDDRYDEKVESTIKTDNADENLIFSAQRFERTEITNNEDDNHPKSLCEDQGMYGLNNENDRGFRIPMRGREDYPIIQFYDTTNELNHSNDDIVQQYHNAANKNRK